MHDDDVIKMEMSIQGATPDIPDEYAIEVEDFYKEFIQTGKHELHAYSSQMFMIDGNPFPYRSTNSFLTFKQT